MDDTETLLENDFSEYDKAVIEKYLEVSPRRKIPPEMGYFTNAIIADQKNSRWNIWYVDPPKLRPGADQSAAEITALRARVAKLERALTIFHSYFVDEAETLGKQLMDGSIHEARRGAIRIRLDGHLHRADIAQAALKGPGHD